MAPKSARIPLPEPETMSQEQRVVFDAIVSGRRGTLVGPLRAALHSPDLADCWQKLGEVLRYKTVFPPVYSELAILVTARRWNSELEWVIHLEAAAEAGLPAPICQAIRDHQLPTFDDARMQDIYDYTSALQNTGQVPADVHARVVEAWGVVGVVELTAITGYYSMVAMTLNAHRIPLPAHYAPELYTKNEEPTGLSQLPLAPKD
jgi:4-carboxymuconolactone decarboxylase